MQEERIRCSFLYFPMPFFSDMDHSSATTVIRFFTSYTSRIMYRAYQQQVFVCLAIGSLWRGLDDRDNSNHENRGMGQDPGTGKEARILLSSLNSKTDTDMICIFDRTFNASFNYRSTYPIYFTEKHSLEDWTDISNYLPR